MWIFGGLGDNNVPLNDLSYLTEDGTEWHSVTTQGGRSVVPRYGHSAVTYKNKWMVVFGGTANKMGTHTRHDALLVFAFDTLSWESVSTVAAGGNPSGLQGIESVPLPLVGSQQQVVLGRSGHTAVAYTEEDANLMVVTGGWGNDADKMMVVDLNNLPHKATVAHWTATKDGLHRAYHTAVVVHETTTDNSAVGVTNTATPVVVVYGGTTTEDANAQTSNKMQVLRLLQLGAACPSPGELQHGRLISQQPVVNSTVQYFCEEGYRLVGNSAAVCKPDTTWDVDIPPVCEDVNECSNSASSSERGQQSNNCSADATCENVEGSYRCSCRKGFTGSGQFCVGTSYSVVEQPTKTTPLLIDFRGSQPSTVYAVPGTDVDTCSSLSNERDATNGVTSVKKTARLTVLPLTVADDDYVLCADSGSLPQPVVLTDVNANGRTYLQVTKDSDRAIYPSAEALAMLPSATVLFSATKKGTRNDVQGLEQCIITEVSNVVESRVGSDSISTTLLPTVEEGEIHVFLVVRADDPEHVPILNKKFADTVVQACSLSWIWIADRDKSVESPNNEKSAAASTASTTLVAIDPLQENNDKKSGNGGIAVLIVFLVLLVLLLACVGIWAYKRKSKREPITPQALAADISSMASKVAKKMTNYKDAKQSNNDQPGREITGAKKDNRSAPGSPKDSEGRKMKDKQSPTLSHKQAVDYLASGISNASPCSFLFDSPMDEYGLNHDNIMLEMQDEYDEDPNTYTSNSSSDNDGHREKSLFTPKSPPTMLNASALMSSTGSNIQQSALTPLGGPTRSTLIGTPGLPVAPPDRMLPSPGGALPGSLLVAPILTPLTSLALEEKAAKEAQAIAAGEMPTAAPPPEYGPHGAGLPGPPGHPGMVTSPLVPPPHAHVHSPHAHMHGHGPHARMFGTPPHSPRIRPAYSMVDPPSPPCVPGPGFGSPARGTSPRGRMASPQQSVAPLAQQLAWNGGAPPPALAPIAPLSNQAAIPAQLQSNISTYPTGLPPELVALASPPAPSPTQTHGPQYYLSPTHVNPLQTPEEAAAVGGDELYAAYEPESPYAVSTDVMSGEALATPEKRRSGGSRRPPGGKSPSQRPVGSSTGSPSTSGKRSPGGKGKHPAASPSKRGSRPSSRAPQTRTKQASSPPPVPEAQDYSPNYGDEYDQAYPEYNADDQWDYADEEAKDAGDWSPPEVSGELEDYTDAVDPVPNGNTRSPSRSKGLGKAAKRERRQRERAARYEAERQAKVNGGSPAKKKKRGGMLCGKKPQETPPGSPGLVGAAEDAWDDADGEDWVSEDVYVEEEEGY
eukprot:TRINITY_DN48155_c0_g1_i1.p1 TRINITY_DN48155_c0_g1~~TRINITY_DN48155_c0_g1_i1.p1  ORF type:complete len:1484 (-),score=181.33 TRINITY_DN48155_c0_g1_i1:1301-5218(-)